MSVLYLLLFATSNFYSISLASNPFKNSKKDTHPFFGYVPKPEYHKDFPTGDISILPETILSSDDVLDSLDWRNYEGENYCTWSRNQHAPYYCGSCWAFSTTSALADRYMIRRGNSFPEISISGQLLLDCDYNDYGCHGGDAASALNYIYVNYITDETCTSYLALGWDVGRDCTTESSCKNCLDDECWAENRKYYQKYSVTSYGKISGVDKMMKELSRGPIICAMEVVDDFYYNYDGGIYMDTTQYDDTDHLISLVGYGTSDDGVDYWIGRNSWGTFWGDNGYFYIIRGENSLNIESECYWMEPDTSILSNLADYEWATNWDSETQSIVYDYTKWATKTNLARRRLEVEEEEKTSQAQSQSQSSSSSIHFKNKFDSSNPNIKIITNEETGTSYAIRSDKLSKKRPMPSSFGLLHEDPNDPFEPIIKGPRSVDTMSDDDLPKSYSWHNVNGKNYLTTPRNQHIPQYCGSCWAFSTTSMVSDRLNILRDQEDYQEWPEVDVSPQALINADYAGDCDGGYPYKALKYMYKNGLPDETCQVYQAQSTPHSDSDLNVCYTCDPLTAVLWPGDCYKIDDFATYYVTEFGSINNDVSEMKKEIYSNGPIACEMYSTDNFWDYEGGIFSERINTDDTDHVVTLVGWSYDSDTDVEYWIGRNSWGMYWGEDGFFRIEMYKDNLNIESNCLWSSVSLDSFNKDETEIETKKELTFSQRMARVAVHALM